MEIDFDRLETCRVFEYDRSLLPNEYLREVESRSYDLRSAVAASGLSIGYPAWNLLYYILYCVLPPDKSEVNIIETGTNVGFSTVVMAQVLKDRRLSSVIHTVDADPLAVSIARATIKKAGLEGFVEFHCGDSVQFLQQYLKKVDVVDFAFLDSDHSAPHVLQEFSLVHPYLAEPYGTVYFDNTCREGVAEALKEIRRRFGGNIVEFPNCSWAPPGNAVWQRER